MNREELNQLSKKIIGLAMKVHRQLGPGFVERIYEEALASELEKSGVRFIKQAKINVNYNGRQIGTQKVDFLIENSIIVELKSVAEINEIHKAQLLSYLKAADDRLGLIFNFAKSSLEFKRMVNKF